MFQIIDWSYLLNPYFSKDGLYLEIVVNKDHETKILFTYRNSIVQKSITSCVTHGIHSIICSEKHYCQIFVFQASFIFLEKWKSQVPIIAIECLHSGGNLIFYILNCVGRWIKFKTTYQYDSKDVNQNKVTKIGKLPQKLIKTLAN